MTIPSELQKILPVVIITVIAVVLEILSWRRF
jgi:hypothetical protein